MVGADSDGGMVGSSKTSFQWLELVVMVVWLVVIKLVSSGWSW